MHRSVLVDVLKALASQLIVLHHLCLYAPMADWLAQAWPAVVALIVDDGRLAVQPFLVMGGFLAAQGLHQRREVPVPALAAQRFVRLAPPLWCALLLVLAATLLVGPALSDEAWVSPLPGWPALLAHLFLLQDLLGVPSVQAGAWYVAIDLQLFVLLAALVAAAGRWAPAARQAVVPAVLAGATVASILVFSRVPALDAWALYFLSAYGLGALAAWSIGSPSARWWWWAVVAVLAADWLLAPRERPLWALATALALHAGHRWSWGAHTGAWGRAVQRLSAWSYGVFVVHYAVVLLASGLWVRLGLVGLPAALATCALVLAVSVALGALVQAACDRLVLRLPRPRPRPASR